MEHNYNNLHLDGNYIQQKKMVHNQIPIKYSRFNLGNLGDLVSAFITILIGAAMIGEVTKQLRKQRVM